MQGLPLAYREANAQALPFGDDEFDTVISAIGVMFAPDHQSAANELVRVCRPGGTIGLISWTLEGFFGQMLATIRPYRPSLSAVVPMSALWGREPYVSALLGNRVRGVKMRRGMLEVSRFDSAEAVHDYFKNHYGPTIEAYANIGDNPVLAAELDAQLIELARRVPGRRRHGMGVSARHRNQAVNRTTLSPAPAGPVPTTDRPTYRRRGRRRAHRRRR